MLPGADPGRQGGGNRFFRLSLTLGNNSREVQRATRLLGLCSPPKSWHRVLILAAFVLKSPPISSYWDPVPTWFLQQYGLCASWNSPCAGVFYSSSPIQTLWCIITFKLAPAFPPAEALVESLSFAQLPVFIKLAQTQYLWELFLVGTKKNRLRSFGVSAYETHTHTRLLPSKRTLNTKTDCFFQLYQLVQN